MSHFKKVALALLVCGSFVGCSSSSGSSSGASVSPKFNMVSSGVEILGEGYRDVLTCVEAKVDNGELSPTFVGLQLDVPIRDYYDQVLNKSEFHFKGFNGQNRDISFALTEIQLAECMALRKGPKPVAEITWSRYAKLVSEVLFVGDVSPLVSEDISDTIGKKPLRLETFNALLDKYYKAYSTLLGNNHKSLLNSWKNSVQKEGTSRYKKNKLTQDYVMSAYNNDGYIRYWKINDSMRSGEGVRDFISAIAQYMTLMTDFCENKDKSLIASYYKSSFGDDSSQRLRSSLRLCSETPREHIKKVLLVEVIDSQLLYNEVNIFS